MEKLKQICGQFMPIHLEGMNGVRLMDRREIKYTIHRELLPRVLKRISKSYDILEINGQSIMPYKSVYFDTRDYRLYTSHQNGKLNRYKVRSRRYELTGVEFLEVKFKNNKKRTVKTRIPLRQREEDQENPETFLKASLPPDFRNLEEKMVVCYQRLMLVDKARTERVTIDINLKYSTPDKEKSFDHLVVIEIKHEGKLADSAMASVLSDMRIRSLSFSKYCLGIYELYKDVKKNFMKIRMRQVEKCLSSQIYPKY